MTSFKRSFASCLLFASLYFFNIAYCSERTKCFHDGSLPKCSTNYQPVCTYFTGVAGCLFAERDSINSCTACVPDDALYYVDGPCQGNKVFCDPVARPDICTLESFPVCAYTADSKYTAGNRCAACSDFDVNYYMIGEC